MPDARALLIAVNRVPSVGAAKVRSLERAFGSLASAAAADSADIACRCKDIGPGLSAEIALALRSGFAAQEEARAAALNVRILTWDDPEYPEALRASASPPLCLYCAGDVRLLRQAQIAVIGTRRASVYGAEQARRFAHRLAEAGLHVLSGLAEGIDSAAHEGALLAGPEAPGRTVAVIGAALDCLYPASRKPLARDIVRAGGLVVSEYPFGRHADQKTFPQRNRIVAALSKGVLVVEAPVKSGTLITVNYAKTCGGRTIYALPGRADWPGFAGNHALLRSGEARLVTSPEHILEDFGTLDLREGCTADGTAAASDVPLGLTPDELKIYEAADADGVSLDELCARTELPMPTVISLTIALQMHKRLRSLPGGVLRRNP